MKLHVVVRKEDLETERLPGKTVVVLDVLFATTSIVAVLAHGATRVLAGASPESCRELSRDHAEGSFLLAGEARMESPDGFASAFPLALLQSTINDRTVIYSTTNGTVALCQSAKADHTYAAALVNARATAEHLLAEHSDSTIVLVCAGSVGRFSLEDFFGAGYLVSLICNLAQTPPLLTDSACAARLLHDSTDVDECLRRSRVGQILVARGDEEELEFATRKNQFDLVAKLVDGYVQRLG